MATDTSTIRVATRTRDRLAARARARGISLAALLNELADAAERDAIFRAEREATRADARNRRAMGEQREWERTLEDGIS